MRVVGIKKLKDKLSEYVRAASAGETILITDRERVVAEINAPSSARPKETGDAALDELIRRSVVRRAAAKYAPLPPRHPTMTLDELMSELDKDRADRW